ncbi:MAG: hypothetical protein GSR78_01045 [Desulfurococcales archaeon]|nr:hypothetical protein [Desulfurococcales archaeon]
MIERYLEWPSGLENFYEMGLEAGAPGGERIIVCGMGGSAVAGDVVSLLAEDIGVEVHVVRRHRLPLWARGGWRVYAVSFSGNTMETVRCAIEAKRRGILAGVVTGGGILASLAEDYGVDRVIVDTPGPPRAALGHVAGALAGLALGEEAGGQIREAAEHMSGYDPMAAASRVARSLSNAGIVFAVSCGRIGGIAGRARSELAENAKIPARDDVYPESGHNDIETLAGARSVSPASLFLEWSLDDECTLILDSVMEYYRMAGPVTLLTSSAPNAFAAFLDLARTVGLATVELARRRGIEAERLSIIPRFRESVSKVLAGRVG